MNSIFDNKSFYFLPSYTPIFFLMKSTGFSIICLPWRWCLFFLLFIFLLLLYDSASPSVFNYQFYLSCYSVHLLFVFCHLYFIKPKSAEIFLSIATSFQYFIKVSFESYVLSFSIFYFLILTLFWVRVWFKKINNWECTSSD